MAGVSSLLAQLDDLLVRSAAESVFRVNSLVGRSVLLQSVVLARPAQRRSSVVVGVGESVERETDL